MAHPQEITDAIHSISTNNDALIKSHDENTI